MSADELDFGVDGVVDVGEGEAEAVVEDRVDPGPVGHAGLRSSLSSSSMDSTAVSRASRRGLGSASRLRMNRMSDRWLSWLWGTLLVTASGYHPGRGMPALVGLVV